VTSSALYFTKKSHLDGSESTCEVVRLHLSCRLKSGVVAATEGVGQQESAHFGNLHSSLSHGGDLMPCAHN